MRSISGPALIETPTEKEKGSSKVLKNGLEKTIFFQSTNSEIQNESVVMYNNDINFSKEVSTELSYKIFFQFKNRSAVLTV